MSLRSMVMTVLGMLVVVLAFDSFFTLPETHRAVLLRFGAIEREDLAPGLHFKLPIFDEVRASDGRVLTIDLPKERFFESDNKPLIVDAFVKWQIADMSAFYRATSGDESRLSQRLTERVFDGLRAQISQRDMHDVISGERDELMGDLTEQLAVVMRREFGVNVIDVRVKAIDLPPEVSSSVYQRMNAEREVLAREYRAQGREQSLGIRADADRQAVVIRAEAEREAQQIRGVGDARAAAIYAEAYNGDPEFYEFTRSLAAYRRAFADKDDVLVIDPNSDFFRYLTSRTGED